MHTLAGIGRSHETVSSHHVRWLAWNVCLLCRTMMTTARRRKRRWRRRRLDASSTGCIDTYHRRGYRDTYIYIYIELIVCAREDTRIDVMTRSIPDHLGYTRLLHTRTEDSKRQGAGMEGARRTRRNAKPMQINNKLQCITNAVQFLLYGIHTFIFIWIYIQIHFFNL